MRNQSVDAYVLANAAELWRKCPMQVIVAPNLDDSDLHAASTCGIYMRRLPDVPTQVQALLGALAQAALTGTLAAQQARPTVGTADTVPRLRTFGPSNLAARYEEMVTSFPSWVTTLLVQFEESLPLGRWARERASDLRGHR